MTAFDSAEYKEALAKIAKIIGIKPDELHTAMINIKSERKDTKNCFDLNALDEVSKQKRELTRNEILHLGKCRDCKKVLTMAARVQADHERRLRSEGKS